MIGHAVSLPLSMRPEPETGVALEFRGVTKSFGPVVALDGFSHRFEPGRVHALMGRNGSGKSTLVKMLAGVFPPDAGEIRLGDTPCRFDGPADAFRAGIVTVHQELSLVPNLSIGENIVLGRLPQRRRAGLRVVDWPALFARAQAQLEAMGLDLDPRAPVATLSVGQQQVVEIVKAMAFQPAVLLLDEPTSALATREVRLLFDLVRRLKASGVTMLYITHRMSELFEIADTCTVLRDGVRIGALDMATASHGAIVEMMFGEAAHEVPRRRSPARGRPVLSVRGLNRAGAFHDIGFDLHAGEVLGIAGLLGSGRTEVLRAIVGADRAESGSVRLHGREMFGARPRDLRAAGLGYAPENRKEAGLVQSLSTADNICMAAAGSVARRGFLTRAMERPLVREQIDDLRIKAGDPELPVSALSGGNQQKVVIGKWMATAPTVMLFDEPSRGVDIRAKRQIFEIIWRKAESGLAALFVSSELEEVLEVADRVLVMRHGRIVAEVDPAATTLTELYGLCMEGTRA